MRKYRKRFCFNLLILLAALFLPLQIGAQTTGDPEMLTQELISAEMAANLGLELLHQLREEDEQYARFLGFTSIEEARQTSLGIPLRIFSGTSEQLLNFQDDSVPDTFFLDTNTITYPLLVNGHTVSSLSVVSYRDKTWRLARIGSAKFMVSVQRNRTSKLNFIIIISDLGLHFLTDRTSGKVALVPVSDAAHLKIKEGVQLSVRELANRFAEQPRYRNAPKP